MQGLGVPRYLLYYVLKGLYKPVKPLGQFTHLVPVRYLYPRGQIPFSFGYILDPFYDSLDGCDDGSGK